MGGKRMAGQLNDTVGPLQCKCGRDWKVRLIEIKVGKDIIEARNYWCEKCDELRD